ncbi:MAG TPA: ExeM/NucH family extracellular endonuclease [Trueperaceae bacterium]
MRRWSIVLIAAVLLALASCTQPQLKSEEGVAPQHIRNPSPVFINEIHYDNDGTDAGEAIEIAGPAGVDLEGWKLVLYNGSNNETYDTRTLSGVLADQQNGFGVLAFTYPVNGLQNGAPDGLALVDACGNVFQFLSYEGKLTATAGPAASMTSTDIGVSESSSSPAGSSLQLAGAGASYADFAWQPAQAATFGEINSGQTFSGSGEALEPCTAPPPPEAQAKKIHEIQGTGDESPFNGAQVTIQGVVVGDFEGYDKLEGFYLQEEDADADDNDATSEGVFVFNKGADDVSVGDLVSVTGTVTEYHGLTEIGSADIDVLKSDVDLPATTVLTLPLEDQNDLEHYEGMLVTFPQELVISEYFNFDRFGEIVLALPLDDLQRPYQPTSYLASEADWQPTAEQIALHSITLDDASGDQNPNPARHPNGEDFTLDNRFRGGDIVQNAVGVLDYRFDTYRLQPTAGADYRPVNPRTDAPEDVGGDVRVASFNVLNYFTTLDKGEDICGPTGGLECRGADTSEEFARQRNKIIAALTAIDADVLGLIEIENSADDAAVQDLVDGLNATAGPGTYAAIETGPIGTDAIKVALLYKPASVTPAGDYAVLDSPEFVDPNHTGEPKNRPALAQTFMRSENGSHFTVVVNHLKSKGSGCGEGDDDPLQGSCNLTRTLAAGVLLDWLAGDPTDANDPDFLLLGDYNSYDEEDPIDRLLAGFDGSAGTDDDITDLLAAHQGEFAYSYVFDGQLGNLDYAFGTATLVEQVTGTTAWHINADEPDLIDYDMSYKKDAQDALYAPTPYRASDHDPVVVGLDLAIEPISATQVLLAHVEDLNLSRGQAGALSAKLEQALDALERDQEHVAQNQLGAFVNQVEDLMQGGSLDEAQGGPLVELARSVMAVL